MQHLAPPAPQDTGVMPHVGDARCPQHGAHAAVDCTPLPLHAGCDSSASPLIWEREGRNGQAMAIITQFSNSTGYSGLC